MAGGIADMSPDEVAFGGRREPGQQFNQLSPAEAERLFLLLEELEEAQQAIGKILRHGYESTHPDGGPTNRESLEREIGDIQSAVRLLIGARDIDTSAITLRVIEKIKAVGQYLHHQKVG